MIRLSFKTLAMTGCFFLFLMLIKVDNAFSEVHRISKEELKAMLDSPDITIIDVRTKSSWDWSAKKIKGAVRENPDNVKSWAGKYPKDRTLILYCS